MSMNAEHKCECGIDKWFGSIVSKKLGEDVELLQSLGVQLGPYNDEEGCFDNCFVDHDTMDQLNEYWGRFYWGLEPILALN